jgi:hypothetical protein
VSSLILTISSTVNSEDTDHNKYNTNSRNLHKYIYHVKDSRTLTDYKPVLEDELNYFLNTGKILYDYYNIDDSQQ